MRCCISKFIYMSLLKYIARLQRMDLLIGMRTNVSQKAFAKSRSQSGAFLNIPLYGERRVSLLMKQTQKGIYSVINPLKIPYYAYQSTQHYKFKSNPIECISGGARYRTIVCLKRLKVFPTQRTVDLWLDQLSSIVTIAIIH